MSQQKCGEVAKDDFLHTFNLSLSIVQSESVFQYPFHNLSFTIFLSWAFFLELSFTIIFPKSFAAICQLQAFFYDPSSTIFLCNLFLLISVELCVSAACIGFGFIPFSCKKTPKKRIFHHGPKTGCFLAFHLSLNSLLQLIRIKKKPLLRLDCQNVIFSVKCCS